MRMCSHLSATPPLPSPCVCQQVIAFSPNAASLALGAPQAAAPASLVPQLAGLSFRNQKDAPAAAAGGVQGPGAAGGEQAMGQQAGQHQQLVSALNARVAKVGRRAVVHMCWGFVCKRGHSAPVDAAVAARVGMWGVMGARRTAIATRPPCWYLPSIVVSAHMLPGDR